MKGKDYLIDTHVLIWVEQDPDRIEHILALLDDPATSVSISSVSWAEVAIKYRAGKLGVSCAQLQESPILASAIPLAFTGNHAAALELLPLHHRDPFDRMLVAQAQAEELSIISTDDALRAYDVPVVWDA